MEREIVTDVEAHPSGSSGRPARSYSYRPQHAFVCGVYAHQRTVVAVLGDASGHVIARKEAEFGSASDAEGRLAATGKVILDVLGL